LVYFNAFESVLKGSKIHSFLDLFFSEKSLFNLDQSLGNLESSLSKNTFDNDIISLTTFNDLFIEHLDKTLAEA
tara:strand:+ start:296 stop:517 length:222 start_codon:yes stop_codon:yes gene_type:complete